MPTPVAQLTERARRRQANQRIHALTCNQYFEAIPVATIADILTECGFNAEPLEGIYCGASSQIEPELVGQRTWVSLSWYRMPSGRYEITCYLS